VEPNFEPQSVPAATATAPIATHRRLRERGRSQ